MNVIIQKGVLCVFFDNLMEATMKYHAACEWCLEIVEAPRDPKEFRIYCCPACNQLDWMFRKWRSDEVIEMEMRYAKE